MGARLASLFLSIVLFAIATLVCGEVGSAQRADTTIPVGRWKTVDEATGKINSTDFFFAISTYPNKFPEPSGGL